jgi:hypothetical protein
VAEGATAVWVVPGLDLQRTTQADRERVAAVLKRRLAAGDGVLLNFSYDPEAEFRPTHPLMELSRAWGIDPQMGRLILRESLGPDGRPRGEAGWIIQRWPDASPLRHALAGRGVQFAGVSPLQLVDRPGVKTQPIATAGDERAWTEAGITTLPQIAAARFDADAAAADAVIAAAAQKRAIEGQSVPVEPGRLMVFSERHWLSDTQAGRRLGNSELFINSVYWLAGLERAIAATPRTQDIRRIGPLTAGQTTAIRWGLLGLLPTAVLVTGTVVWWRRRRG